MQIYLQLTLDENTYTTYNTNIIITYTFTLHYSYLHHMYKQYIRTYNTYNTISNHLIEFQLAYLKTFYHYILQCTDLRLKTYVAQISINKLPTHITLLKPLLSVLLVQFINLIIKYGNCRVVKQNCSNIKPFSDKFDKRKPQ